MTNHSAALRAMPWVFVLIWSTGFIVARLAMPHAPAFGFLAMRFGLSLLAFSLWLAITRPAWPKDRVQLAHLAVTGMLMHAGYLGGVWFAIKAGLGAGMAALIVGFQPLLTALWISGGQRSGETSGHKITAKQWLGLVLGLAGLVLVVSSKLQLGEIRLHTVGAATLALLSITVGTLYQKRWVQPCDVRSASAVQLLAALLVTLPLAAWETEAIRWHPDMLIALLWSVFAMTLGASSLLYLLIQRGAATSVASLMYLVPPCTAIMAAALFGEALSFSVILGLLLTAVGVALAVRNASGR